jgi:hypothetical protein
MARSAAARSTPHAAAVEERLKGKNAAMCKAPRSLAPCSCFWRGIVALADFTSDADWSRRRLHHPLGALGAAHESLVILAENDRTLAFGTSADRASL